MAWKILVPTDFSLNAKAGVRFALQLAQQGKHALVFYHSIQLMKPTRWSDTRYETYVEKEKSAAARNFVKLVKSVAMAAGIKKSKVDYVIEQHTDPTKAIVEYALKIGASAICMSTRGGGRLKKVIGTHASGIIRTSPVPVFIIPDRYRRKPVKKILYASDLNQISKEIKVVKKVAGELKAKVLVYHYDYLADVKGPRKNLEKIAKRYTTPGLSFKFRKHNVGVSLATHLLSDIKISKSSMVVLFSNKNRGWFDRLFLPSNSVGMAFDTKTPLLIFPKAKEKQ